MSVHDELRYTSTIFYKNVFAVIKDNIFYITYKSYARIKDCIKNRYHLSDSYILATTCIDRGMIEHAACQLSLISKTQVCLKVKTKQRKYKKV